MPTDAPLRIYCLGRFHVEATAGDVDILARAQPRPLSLLKTLIALGARNVPEDQLLEALWPEADGDAAHTAFTSTLYRLRLLMGQDALTLRNRLLSLDPRTVWWDVRAFEIAADALEAALASDPSQAETAVDALLALYRGPFLDGEFDPPDVLTARERLHGRFLRVVREAGERLEEMNRIEVAQRLYAKALETDQVAEELCQVLMRSLGQAGRLAEAEAAYQRLRRSLEAQGGGAPAAQTEMLRNEIAERGRGPHGDAEVNAQQESPVSPAANVPGLMAPTSAGRMGQPRYVAGASVILAGIIAVSTAIGVWVHRDQAAPDAFTIVDATERTPPEGPSIVVLPFTNMTGDSAQEFFADGLTDTLITDLSQLRKILVIARNSAFAYKGKAVDARLVGRELGVNHILEGSIQTTGDRIRINVQLIETNTGAHVWAERYDRPMQDLFRVQDELARRIVEELDVSLVTGEQARNWRRMTDVPEAYAEVLAGRAIQAYDHSVDGMMLSRKHFRRAIELDPGFALPYAYMVSIYIHLTDAGYRLEPDVSYDTALRYANRAIELNPDLAIARAYRCAVYQQLQRYAEVVPECKLAVEKGPNLAESLMLSAWGIAAVGDPEEALPLALRAFRLDPVPPGWYWGALADTYLRMHEWEQAIPVYTRCLRESLDLIWCRAGLTVALSKAGRMDEARRSAQEWRRLNPNVNGRENFYLLAYGDPGFKTLMAEALVQAGM